MNILECLKELNPSLVLYLNDDADTVKNWINRLKGYEAWRASVESEIYNGGRIGITAQARRPGSCNDSYMIFNSAPLTDFIRKLHHAHSYQLPDSYCIWIDGQCDKKEA